MTSQIFGLAIVLPAVSQEHRGLQQSYVNIENVIHVYMYRKHELIIGAEHYFTVLIANVFSLSVVFFSVFIIHYI